MSYIQDNSNDDLESMDGRNSETYKRIFEMKEFELIDDYIKSSTNGKNEKSKIVPFEIKVVKW